jgi:predicted transglutaminase-like cysteine proteinase
MTQTVKKLREIHSKVLNGFTYKRESFDSWCIPHKPEEATGDCEDFALACRMLCRKAGIESRLVTCWTETGGYHCVLESGGWVLDNRHTTLTTKDNLPYRWDRISGFNAGDPWKVIL